MKNLLVTLIACAIGHAGMAQLSIGAHYNYHQAVSVYGENIGVSPQGMSMAVFYNLKNNPFSVGLEMGKSGYNQRHFGRSFQSADWGLVNTDIREMDVMSHIHILTRYHFISDAAFEPYAEGRAGMLSFATVRSVGAGTSVDTGTEVMNRSEVGDHFSCMDYHSTAFQAGIGLGTIVNLKHLICPTKEEYGFEIKLDLGATYYLGSSALYNGVGNEVNQSAVHRSPTNNISYRMGVIVVLR